MTKDGEWCALCDLDRMEADIQKARSEVRYDTGYPKWCPKPRFRHPPEELWQRVQSGLDDMSDTQSFGSTARLIFGWSLSEIRILVVMFREKFGPNVLPSQVKLKSVDKEGLNPPGPRHF